jgi:putative hemolysin
MDMSFFVIGMFVVCLVLSAYFSGTETALTTLSHAKTKQLLDSKKAWTRSLNLWLKKPNQVLATLLVYDCAVNTLAASIATVVAERYFGSLAIGIATGAVTILLLIFGEITPKTYCRHNAATIAPPLMTILVPLYWLISPIVWALTTVSSWLVRLLGGHANHHGPAATEEDITFMIRLGHEEGVLEREEGKMLESVIEFRDTLVRETMVPRTEIFAFEKNATMDDVMAGIRQHGHSRWPVYENNVDNIIGIFNSKDLLYAFSGEKKPAKAFSLGEVMRPALFVPESMKVVKLLKEFRRGKAHLAVVVDEYGGTAGIITLEDVLEELVGEIRDEYDTEEEEALIKKIDDTHYWASGRASISLIEETFDIEFADEEVFDSLAGFLMVMRGKMPKAGEFIDIPGFRFFIKDADEKRIKSVIIEKLQKDSPTAKDGEHNADRSKDDDEDRSH